MQELQQALHDQEQIIRKQEATVQELNTSLAALQHQVSLSCAGHGSMIQTGSINSKQQQRCKQQQDLLWLSGIRWERAEGLATQKHIKSMVKILIVVIYLFFHEMLLAAMWFSTTITCHH